MPGSGGWSGDPRTRWSRSQSPCFQSSPGSRSNVIQVSVFIYGDRAERTTAISRAAARVCAGTCLYLPPPAIRTRSVRRLIQKSWINHFPFANQHPGWRRFDSRGVVWRNSKHFEILSSLALFKLSTHTHTRTHAQTHTHTHTRVAWDIVSGY